MDKDQIQQALASIKNLKAFAEKSGIPRRTLCRVKDGAMQPHRTTLMAIEAALKRYRPEQSAEDLPREPKAGTPVQRRAVVR